MVEEEVNTVIFYKASYSTSEQGESKMHWKTRQIESRVNSKDGYQNHSKSWREHKASSILRESVMDSVDEEMESNKSAVVKKPEIFAMEDKLVDKVFIERSYDDTAREHEDSHE
jgi:hypothetical protein